MISCSWPAAALAQSSVTVSAGVQLPARDHVGLTEEPPDLGAPGLPALLALVRDQIVIPGNAVHRGGERILFQPAPVHPVGQVTC